MVSVGSISSVVNALTGQVGLAHRFSVVLDDPRFELGEWEKASGLSVSWEPCVYRVGDMGNDVLLYAGLPKYETIKLTKAACGDSSKVQQWLASTSKKAKPLTGAIALTDWVGMPIMQWPLKEFIPIGRSIVEFEAGGNKIATETLQLAHTGFLDDQVASGRVRGW